MNKSTISIVIPVYNTPRELGKCLRSLEKQTGVDLEVIVVDDGSENKLKTQNSKLKIKEDFDIRFFSIEHGGAPRARNFGLKQAKGDYILFCDADMELRQDCLEKMTVVLRDNPQASYAYSDFKYGWKKFRFWPFDADKLKEMNYVNTCSLIRREALEGIKWDESLQKFQDWDLWLQLLAKGRTGVYIPEILFKANIKRGTMSKWLPSFVYRLPFLKLKSKEKYEQWKRIVQEKHKIGVNNQ